MKDMYRELGFLGNSPEELTIDWVYTELVQKAEQGDKTALYNLSRISRYSTQEEVVVYARDQLTRILAAQAEAESGDDETGKEPEEPEEPGKEPGEGDEG